MCDQQQGVAGLDWQLAATTGRSSLALSWCMNVNRIGLGIARHVVLENLLYECSGSRVDANVILCRGFVPTDEAVFLAVRIHLTFVLTESLFGQIALRRVDTSIGDW
jgi:hypothetical protein